MLIDRSRGRERRHPEASSRRPPPPRDVTVRVANSRDVATVADLRLSLVAEEAPLARRTARMVSRARRLTAAHLGSAGDVTFLAVAGGRDVGMVRCVEVHGASLLPPARYAVLTSAYVRPEFRRRGALRALVEAAEAWCRSRRLREIRLHCAVGNDGGQAAWSALGFTAADIRFQRSVPAP